jgi:hypothetical protein
MKRVDVRIGILLKVLGFLPAVLAFTLSRGEERLSPRFSVFNVEDFGAAGDGTTLDTYAIQSAIEACREAGGGTVYLPSGTFVSGTLRMYGRMTLFLDAGSVLLASPDTSQYGFQSAFGLSSASSSGVLGSGAGRRTGLIVAKDAEDVTVSGQGALDGNGYCFFDFKNPHRALDFDPKLTRQGQLFLNPRYAFEDGPFLARAGWDDRPGTMAIFWSCKNVRILGVTIRNAPNWTVHFQQCDGVEASGVTIRNSLLIPNDDGFDVYDSRNVRISDCLIHTGDDCIAVIGSENVSVSNCVLKSRSAGIRIGYGTKDVRDCAFQNVVIDTSNRGIGVFVRGSGSVENVLFSNVVIHTKLFNGNWWGKGEPIHVSVLPYGGGETGRIRNLRFSNVSAEGESGIVLYGCPDSPISDVALEGVRLRLCSGRNGALVGGNFDLRPSIKLETALFKHGIPGVFGRFIDGLRVQNLDLEWSNPLPAYFSNGIECENANRLVIDGFSGKQASGSGAAISLTSCRAASVRNCRAGEGTGTFLLLSGANDGGTFVNNDLRNSKKAILPEENGFFMSGNQIP